MIKSQKARQNIVKTHNGTLNTLIKFYKTTTDDSIDGRDIIYEKLFEAYAEVYSPSSKDISIMNGKGVKKGMTVRLRDPLTSYYPDNKEVVLISDGRFSDMAWDIVDIRPDVIDRRFIIILLSGDNGVKLCQQKCIL